MKPDLVLDTNVVLEQVDLQDLVRVIESTRDLASPLVQSRRRRARHAILLSWHCHVAKLRTGFMWHEVAEMMLRQPRVDANAPGELPTLLSSLIVHFVHEVLLCDWTRGVLADIGIPTGTDADNTLLQWAKDVGVPLITNEGLRADGTVGLARNSEPNLRGKAIRDGVPVFTPEEFLRAKSVDTAREAARFLDAFDRWPRSDVRLPIDGIASATAIDAAMDKLRVLYGFVLLDS